MYITGGVDGSRTLIVTFFVDNTFSTIVYCSTDSNELPISFNKKTPNNTNVLPYVYLYCYIE